MSIVTFVPETRGLEGDDAAETMRRVDRWDLLRDSAIRFRYADGFSFARAIAFQVVLLLFPALIVLVAVAISTGNAGLQATIEEITRSVTPGPATDAFAEAFEQAEDTARRNWAALIGGGITAVVAAVTAMSQIQRGMSRLYGVRSDRPTVKRYVRATSLALSVGSLLTLALVAVAFGDGVGGPFANEWDTTWSWLRWPLGTLLAGVGIAIIYRYAPNRQQPSVAWLMTGGLVATVVWLVLTIALTLYLNGSATFGDTYGPLAGFIGVLLWAQLTGIAILFGGAFAAQLEAERAGVSEPIMEADEFRRITTEEYIDA
jgi:YihY family inner membrane protein